MICAIVDSSGLKVEATDSDKQHGPFRCPQCQAAVMIRKGRLKIHHFAHKPPVTCDYGRGETEEHRRCKTEIFRELRNQPGVTELELERSMGKVRPDVFAMINGIPVAIEVQLSALTPERLSQRTQEYYKLGVAVLWLAQRLAGLDESRYSPRLWERWVHAACYGRIYCWSGALSIIPYRLEEFRLYRPTSEWHGEHGEPMSAGGYERRSKRYRTPKRGRTLDLMKDFRPAEQTAFETRLFDLPARKLFMDRYRWEQLVADT